MIATHNVKLSIEAGGYFNIALLALISVQILNKRNIILNKVYVLAVDSNNASKIVPVRVSVVGCVLPETVHIIYFGRNRQKQKENKSETVVTIVKHD